MPASGQRGASAMTPKQLDLLAFGMRALVLLLADVGKNRTAENLMGKLNLVLAEQDNPPASR